MAVEVPEAENLTRSRSHAARFSLDGARKAVPAQATTGVLAADIVDFHDGRLPSRRQPLLYTTLISFPPSFNQGYQQTLLYTTRLSALLHPTATCALTTQLSLHAHHQVPTIPPATRTSISTSTCTSTPPPYVCLGDIELDKDDGGTRMAVVVKHVLLWYSAAEPVLASVDDA